MSQNSKTTDQTNGIVKRKVPDLLCAPFYALGSFQIGLIIQGTQETHAGGKGDFEVYKGGRNRMFKPDVVKQA